MLVACGEHRCFHYEFGFCQATAINIVIRDVCHGYDVSFPTQQCATFENKYAPDFHSNTQNLPEMSDTETH